MRDQKEYRAEWQKLNKEKCREYSRKNRKQNKDSLNKRSCELRRINIEIKLKYEKKWRENNREKIREAARKYRFKTIKSRWLDRTLQSAKARCKERGLEFNLEKSDIFIPEVCPILNVPISQNNEKDYRPSLDRIDNTKGYTKDNVRIISMRANRIKSDASLKELEAIVAYIKTNNA